MHYFLSFIAVSLRENIYLQSAADVPKCKISKSCELCSGMCSARLILPSATPLSCHAVCCCAIHLGNLALLSIIDTIQYKMNGLDETHTHTDWSGHSRQGDGWEEKKSRQAEKKIALYSYDAAPRRENIPKKHDSVYFNQKRNQHNSHAHRLPVFVFLSDSLSQAHTHFECIFIFFYFQIPNRDCLPFYSRKLLPEQLT